LLLFKIVLAPILIAAVSLAGRKWGPTVAGWLLGLPLTSAPVLLFLSLEQGPQFASQSARGSMLGLLAWAAFNFVFAATCLKLNWWQSTLIGWIAYFIVAALLLPVALKIGWVCLVVVAVLFLMLWFFPRTTELPETGRGKYDLWFRMASASGMVLLITAIARMLGATATGILTAFPAYSTILAVFSHRQHPQAAIHVLKGVTAGLYTAAAFFLALSLALSRLSVGWSFAVAAAAALPVQMGSLVYLRIGRSGDLVIE
jgi:hypothetical protein